MIHGNVSDDIFKDIVREVRRRSGVGMMYCKKAVLAEMGYDVEELIRRATLRVMETDTHPQI